MIVITRTNAEGVTQYAELAITEAEFYASSYPIKEFPWSIYTGPWPLPVPEPPVYIPTSVTMRQARLQLSVLGVYSSVNAAVSGMSEQAQIEWEYATSVDRNNTLTQQMIALLGWTEEQADTYFLEASKL